jgi:hypothetical protein
MVASGPNIKIIATLKFSAASHQLSLEQKVNEQSYLTPLFRHCFNPARVGRVGVASPSVLSNNHSLAGLRGGSLSRSIGSENWSRATIGRASRTEKLLSLPGIPLRFHLKHLQ